MAHVVQQCVVDGLPDVPDRPLNVAGGNDLVRARCVLIGGQDANLSPRHLLLVYVHRLDGGMERERHRERARERERDRERGREKERIRNQEEEGVL